MSSEERNFRLLRLFRALPKVRHQPTFMQIAGYPHYENVCSNVLAFFLGSEKEHGLGDIVLRAFLLCVGQQDLPISDVEVRREFGVSGKRLDIRVTSKAFVMGIENKIWHHVANPLDLYAQAMSDLAGNGRKVLKIVLSPKTPTDTATLRKLHENGFVSVTYPSLFANLKPLIGHQGPRADVRYLTYLNDFITTIEALMGTNPENQRADAFFQENGADIEALYEQYKAFQKRQFTELTSCLQGLGSSDPVVEIKTFTDDSAPKIFVSFRVAGHLIQIETSWNAKKGSWVAAAYSIPVKPRTDSLKLLRNRVCSVLEADSQFSGRTQREDWGIMITASDKASIGDVADDFRHTFAKVFDVVRAFGQENATSSATATSAE